MQRVKIWVDVGAVNRVAGYWANFAQNHPRAARMLVTVMQYVLLTFMPALFARWTSWENIDCYLIPTFNTGKYIFQFPAEAGGMAYFAGYGITLLAA